MKKIFLIIAILFSFIFSHSQTIVNRSSAAVTAQDARLSAQLNLYMPRAKDTTLNGGLDTLGAIIYKVTDGTFWIRDTNLISAGHKWTKIIKSGQEQNLATANLIATGDWTHNWKSKQLQIDSIGLLGVASKFPLSAPYSRWSGFGTTQDALLLSSSIVDNSGPTAKKTNSILLGSDQGNDGLFLIVSDSTPNVVRFFLTKKDTPRVETNAFLYVRNKGFFQDTLTGTTMGNPDSSNRVASTAWVKRQGYGSGGGGGITGSGAANQLTFWTGASAVSGNSGITTPSTGALTLTGQLSAPAAFLTSQLNITGSGGFISLAGGSGTDFQIATNNQINTLRLGDESGSTVQIGSGGASIRGISASTLRVVEQVGVLSGNLQVKNVPFSSAWNDDSTVPTRNDIYDIALTFGTVTNVATGYGLSGGPITTTGTLLVDSATLSTYYLRRKDSTLYTTITRLKDTAAAIRAAFPSAGTAINNTNVGSGFRVLTDPSLQTLRTLFGSNTVGLDTSSNAAAITIKGDTSVLATQYDLTQLAIPTLQQVTTSGNTTTTAIIAADYRYNGFPNFRSVHRDSTIYKGNAFGDTGSWRDSTEELRGVARVAVDGSGNAVWSLLHDTDHEPIGIDSLNVNGAAQLEIFYPTVGDVHASSIVTDEQLARLGVISGASVGLNKTTLFAYMPSTWGGAIFWNATTKVWYADGAVVNNNVPSAITYDSTTGILTMTVATIQTTGSERDYKKLAANMDQEGIKVTYMVANSNNTTLQFKITGTNGSILPPTDFNNNTALTFVMPTRYTAVPLGFVGGSNAWLASFINSQSNFWIMQTHKRIK